MTAVEQLIDWMGKNQYFIGNDLLQAAEQFKELEEKRMLEFAGIVSVAAVARGTGWSIRDLYNEYK